jgi:hypothetical protein
MEEICIVRNTTSEFKNLFDVHHIKWMDGEPKLIKTIETEVTFDRAVDLREHHMNLLDIPEVEEV